ncbi:MAG: ribonuclease HI family protein [Actinobacteria bacterium]|nr:ribonuclease HI family protein [Actinomycetota bacterium]
MQRGDRLIVFADGGARGNPGPAAIGAVVVDPSTEPPNIVATVSEAIGVATNNVAEYRAVIAGLEAAAEAGARSVELRADSQLVIRHLDGSYRVKNPGLRVLYDEAVGLLARFADVRLVHVPREQNTDADALVNAALDAAEQAR